jgi:hypothetical protein
MGKPGPQPRSTTAAPRAKLAVKRDRERTSTERRLGEVRRTLDRMIDDIAFGRLDAVRSGQRRWNCVTSASA